MIFPPLLKQKENKDAISPDFSSRTAYAAFRERLVEYLAKNTRYNYLLKSKGTADANELQTFLSGLEQADRQGVASYDKMADATFGTGN